jgi:hypothetical protein
MVFHIDMNKTTATLPSSIFVAIELEDYLPGVSDIGGTLDVEALHSD